MMQELPISVKRSIELMGLILIALVVNHFQNIIMPLLMALVTSIALLPIRRFLLRKKIPNTISIILTMLLMVIVLTLISFLILTQLRPLINDFSEIKDNIINHVNVISTWFSTKTDISTAFNKLQLKSRT